MWGTKKQDLKSTENQEQDPGLEDELWGSLGRHFLHAECTQHLADAKSKPE